MKKLILLASFFLISGQLPAQQDKGLNNLSEAKSASLEVTTNFKEQKITEAFQKLRNIWILNETEISRLEKTVKEQQSVVSDNYGKAIDVKLAEEELVEDILYKLTYVVRHEWHAMKLTFIFYHGKGNLWYLNNFNWDDKISELVD